MSTTVHGPGSPTPPTPEPPALTAADAVEPTPVEPAIPPEGTEAQAGRQFDVDLGSEETVEQQLEQQGFAEHLGERIRPSADDVLFDGTPYQNLKPNVDDEETDTAKVTITGGWDINLEDPVDVAWFNRIQRGQSVTLRIEAECTDRIAPAKRRGDDLTITGVMKLKVTQVYRLTPEQL